MKNFKFDMNLSIGHVVQIVTLVFLLVGGYFQLKADAAENRSEGILARQILSSRIDSNVSRIDNTGAMLNQRLESIGDTLEQMQSDLSER